MEKYLEQAVQSLITPEECKLCSVKVRNPTVNKQHYASKRHKKNFALYINSIKEILCSSGVSEDNLQENCQSKDEKHITESGPKTFSNEDLYCKTCEVQTASKEQMWNHLKQTTHQEKVIELGHPQINGDNTPFSVNLPKEVKDQMLVDICHICSNSFATVSQALDHYGSIKHDVAVRRWFKEKRQVAKSAKNVEPDEIKTETKKTVGLYCCPCKIYLNSKQEKEEHIQSFPHVLLVKLKSVLLKEGIVEEYWSAHGRRVVCLLCNRMMCAPTNAVSHINSIKHRENYVDWYINLPPRKVAVDVRWYYCKICDKDLDGTSESEHHYADLPHSEKSQLYCYICNVSNATLDLLDAHKSSSLHIEMLQKSQKPIAVWEEGAEQDGKNALCIMSVDSETNKTERDPEASNSDPSSTPKQCEENANITTDFKYLGKYNETVSSQQLLENALDTNPGHCRPDANITNSSKSIEDSSTTSTRKFSEGNSNTCADSKSLKISLSNNAKKLKEQVFNELEQLVQKLYYSKTVPYDIALNYLKRMNREVDELLRKHSSTAKQHASKLGQTIYTNEDMYRQEPGLVLEKFYGNTENAGNEFIDNYTEEDILQPTQFKLLDTTKSKIVRDLDHPNTVTSITGPKKLSQKHCSTSPVNDSVFSDSDEKMGTLERNNSGTKINTENNVDKKARNISGLILNVVERKREIEQDYSNELSSEKEVLNEMEIFLRQVEDGGVPLEEILRYLESVNEELQTKEFEEPVVPNEEQQTKEFDEPVETLNEQLQTKEFDEPPEIPNEEKEKGEKSGINEQREEAEETNDGKQPEEQEGEEQMEYKEDEEEILEDIFDVSDYVSATSDSSKDEWIEGSVM